MKYRQATNGKVSSKDRRNSGRVVTKIYDPKEQPYEETKWDDWNDYRDGFRQPIDKTQIRSEHTPWSKWFNVKKWNQKIRKLLDRRRAMKNANSNRNG